MDTTEECNLYCFFLVKVVMDDGRSERITVVENVSTTSSQHAVTEYRVLESSIHGSFLIAAFYY